MEQYAPRNLNQDALENFSGQIRQHRCRLSCLSPKQFQESCKAVMVKHISSKCCISTHNLTFDGPRLMNKIVDSSLQNEFSKVVFDLVQLL